MHTWAKEGYFRYQQNGSTLLIHSVNYGDEGNYKMLARTETEDRWCRRFIDVGQYC